MDRPTCKVVARPGQRGGRIAPKGCKVRKTQEGGGQIRSYTKAGVEKSKVLTKRLKYTLTASKNGHRVSMIFDTGAMVTTIKQADANRWGLGAPAATKPLTVASGATIQAPVHTGVAFSVRINGRRYPVTSTLYVTAGDRLLGVDSIRQLPGVSVKYVQ